MKPGPLRIALLYVIVSILWILLNKPLLSLLHNRIDSHIYLLIQTYKSYLFVMILCIQLYLILLSDRKKLMESERQYRLTAEENKRLASIITRVNNIIIITDKNNLITWVNKAVEDFTGYQFSELAGKSPGSVIMTVESDREVLQSIVNGKKALASFSEDISCYNKRGEVFCVSGEFTPLFDDDHIHTGYIAVYSNVTWRKQKEEEITLQNNKLKEVAWLSSHEVRRPLANIMGLTNLMRVSPEMDERIKILERIHSSAKELDEIVHTINQKIVNEFENAGSSITTFHT